jgi:hypothetical protein
MFGVAVPPIQPHTGQGAGDGWAFLAVAIVALVALVAWVAVLWVRGRVPTASRRELYPPKELPRAAWAPGGLRLTPPRRRCS